MLNNFQLAAIVRQGSISRVQRIPLLQELQTGLAKLWEIQRSDFEDGKEEISFSWGYELEQHEQFQMVGYELPSWLAGVNSQTILDLDILDKQATEQNSIRGIVAIAQDDLREDMMLFQNFTRSRVIKPGYFLFLAHNTYKGVEHPGLTLDNKLSAVFQPVHRKLLFNNLRTVNSFIPLSDYYREATESEIRKVLSHELLAAEDPDKSIADINQWSRKRFAMLKESGVLDRYTAEQIKDQSKGHSVFIKVLCNKVVFPADKAEAKRVLQFLNEELYLGPITDTPYETNSKRATT